MPADASPRSARPVQAEALAAIVRRMARSDEPPWLHGEVARRMAERLQVIRLQPQVLTDWWSFNGASQALLQQAYPKARVCRVEADDARRRSSLAAAGKRGWLAPRLVGRAVEVRAPHEPGPASELLWANMMLHLVDDPPALMRQWHQALAVDGFLMFSTLGPGSLAGLRDVYQALGWPPPHAPFIDIHDLGDMLLRSGFADPVMDQEIVTLTWPDAAALLRELRMLGGNADLARTPGLRTPRWRERLVQALEALRGGDGRLRLDFELVYGHALRAPPRPRVAGQTTVPLEDMRDMVRAGRRSTGAT